jgi:hypothetical protein
METDANGAPQPRSVAEYFRRFEQQLAEADAAIGQLGEKIRQAEQKSKYVIHEVVPAVPDT